MYRYLASSKIPLSSLTKTFYPFPRLPAELKSLVEEFTDKSTLPHLLSTYLSNQALTSTGQLQNRLLRDILLSEAWLKVYNRFHLLEDTSVQKMAHLGETLHLCGPIDERMWKDINAIYTKKASDGSSMSPQKAPVWASYHHLFGTSKREATIPVSILSIFDGSPINTHQVLTYGVLGALSKEEMAFLSQCQRSLGAVPNSQLSIYIFSTPNPPNQIRKLASSPQLKQADITATARIAVDIILKKHKKDDLTFQDMSDELSACLLTLSKLGGGGTITIKGVGYPNVKFNSQKGKISPEEMHADVSKYLREWHCLPVGRVQTIMSTVRFVTTSGVKETLGLS